MLAPSELGRWLAAAVLTAGLAACAAGRQVYQTAQGPGSEAFDDAPAVSLSGAEVGSDRILQLSGNVVLPVYRLDGGLGLDVRVALQGAQVQASLAAPALLGGAALAPPPGGATSATVAALRGQVAGDTAQAGGAPLAALGAPSPLATVDLGGALGSSAAPPGLVVGAALGGVTSGVAGAVNPINAAVASLPRPVGR